MMRRHPGLWLAVLALTAGCEMPKPKWKVAQVSVQMPAPAPCNTVVTGGHLAVVDNQAVQPVPDNQPSKDFNLFDNMSFCAVSDVKVTLGAAEAAQWKAGDTPVLFVAHHHFATSGEQLRYLAYNAPVATSGQTTLTFTRVVVASGSRLDLYQNGLRVAPGVNFGQWPKQKAGDKLQAYGDVLPKNCTLNTFGTKVTC